MIDLEAIRARDELAHYADVCIADQHRWNATRADRRALLAYVDELREAAGKVTCKRCFGNGIVVAGWELNPAPCPDCAPLRGLLAGEPSQ